MTTKSKSCYEYTAIDRAFRRPRAKERDVPGRPYPLRENQRFSCVDMQNVVSKKVVLRGHQKALSRTTALLRGHQKR
jgi:hypothetical protein